MTIRKGLALVSALLLLAIACNPLRDPEPPRWNMDLYGPLSLVTVELSDLFSGQVFTYSTSVTPKDITSPAFNFPPDSPIPSFGPTDLPPIDTLISEEFRELLLGYAVLTIDLENGWPINIRRGTIVAILNDGGDELLSFTLADDIAPNGGKLKVEIPVENVRYTSRLSIVFKEFRTSGSGGVPVTLDDQELKFTFAPRDMDILEMTITDNREIPYEEANDFSITSERIEALGVLGKFYTIFSNPHPFSFSNQSYLLRQDSTVLDSIFARTQLIMGTQGLLESGACPNLQGDVQVIPEDATLQNPVLNRDTITLDESRLANMNAARIVRIRGFICLPPNPDGSGVWIMRKEDVISLQIIGDINLSVNLSPDNDK